MSPRWTYFRLALLVGSMLPATGVTAAVTVDEAVVDAVAAGRARVIVELEIPGGVRPEGTLTEDGAKAQRDAIAAAQQSVLSELSGTDAQLTRRSRTAPFLALELGPSALARLREMPETVLRIFEDKAAARQ